MFRMRGPCSNTERDTVTARGEIVRKLATGVRRMCCTTACKNDYETMKSDL